MSDDKDLSEEQKRNLREEVQRGMAIADSTSGHDPLPLLLEKTPEEKKKFVETCVKLFTNAIDSI